MQESLKVCLLMSVALFAVVQRPTLAQTAPKQTAGPEFGADEIIVTATRREETVQSVPLAITAVSGDALAQQGARGYEDYLRNIPGVNFNAGAANNSNFAIRGLSTETSNANLQPTVALYLNDLPTVDPSFPIGFTDLPTFDIARVEVLRGPQGTLFGSGSLGGAIRVITNQPKLGELQYTAEVRGAVTQDGSSSYGAAGMINAPLGERIALRGVVDIGRVGGVIDNVRRNVKDADKIDTFSGRLALAFEPTESIKIVASVLHNNSRPKDNTLANDNSPTFIDTVVLQPYETNSVSPEVQRNRLTIASLDVNVDLGFAQLTSISSYSWRRIFRSRDFGELDSPISFLFTGTPLPSDEITKSSGRTLSQELRIASTGDTRLSWLAGVFFIRRTNNSTIIEGDPGYIGSGLENPGTGNIVDTQFKYLSRELAGFGELAYQITDSIKASVSGRYFSNLERRNDIVAWAFGPGLPGFRRYTSDGFTPRGVIEYKRDNLLVYGSFSRGYRVGGPNLPLPGLPPSFDPDKVSAYELGAKTQWFDRMLTLNASLFRNDWTDIQVNEIINNLAALTNGPSARSQGLEVEAMLRLPNGLEIGATAAYTDAELRGDALSVNVDRGGLRAGQKLPGVPEFTASASVQYSFDLSDAARAYVLAVQSYASRSYNGFDRTNAFVKPIGSWYRMNLRAGVEYNQIEASIYVDNLFNSDAIQNVQYNGGFQRDSLARMRPRTFGLTLRFKNN